MFFPFLRSVPVALIRNLLDLKTTSQAEGTVEWLRMHLLFNAAAWFGYVPLLLSIFMQVCVCCVFTLVLCVDRISLFGHFRRSSPYCDGMQAAALTTISRATRAPPSPNSLSPLSTRCVPHSVTAAHHHTTFVRACRFCCACRFCIC
jgi:hypothetical protein